MMTGELSIMIVGNIEVEEKEQEKCLVRRSNIPFMMADSKIRIFNMSKIEFERRIKIWENGNLIQNAFDNCSTDEREFILNGNLF